VNERFAFNPPSPSPSLSATEDKPTPHVASAFRRSPDWRKKTATPKGSEAAEPTADAAAFKWTLAFTAVLFLRPQDIFPPLAALHLAELTAIAALISLVMGRLSRGQPITRMTPELAGVLAFGFLMLLTAPFSIWMGGAFGTFQDLYLKVILVYLLCVNVLSSPKRLERLIWILVITVGYFGFRAVLDYARGVNVVRGGTRVMGSVGGFMQNPNDMALNMVAFLPLAALVAMHNRSIFKRLVAAACALFMMGAIVASGSRGGFLGFGAMLVVLAAFSVKKHPMFVMGGVLVVICALPLAPSSYWQRIASIADDSKDDVQSSQARKALMGQSLEAFMENPLTGVGAGCFKDWNPKGRSEAWHEAHNVWLQVAAELGIFGFAAFFFLVMRAFFSVFQTRRLLQRNGGASGSRDLLDAHSAAMAASLTGWFVCAFFASVAYNWTFYYLLALAAAPREILRDSAFATRTIAAAVEKRFGALAPAKVRA
jgi:probable O-glycosylation ligase (exosortase A-associated)